MRLSCEKILIGVRDRMPSVRTANRAMFLDRDGVLNSLIQDSSALGRSPRSLSEFRLYDGAARAVNLAASADYLPVVVTNQPEISRGLLSKSALHQMHEHLRNEIPCLEHIYVCDHDGSWCQCRKPRPGMLLRAALDLGIDLQKSWMVGDRWIDVAAAKRAGCRAALVESPFSWASNSSGEPGKHLDPDVLADDVEHAVSVILERSR